MGKILGQVVRESWWGSYATFVPVRPVWERTDSHRERPCLERWRRDSGLTGWGRGWQAWPHWTPIRAPAQPNREEDVMLLTDSPASPRAPISPIPLSSSPAPPA